MATASVHPLNGMEKDTKTWRNYVSKPWSSWPADAQASWKNFVAVQAKVWNHNFWSPFLLKNHNWRTWPPESQDQWTMNIGFVNAQHAKSGNKITKAVKTTISAVSQFSTAVIKPVTTMNAKTFFNPIEGTKKSIKDARNIVGKANAVIESTNVLGSAERTFNRKGISRGGLGKTLGHLGEKARTHPIETTALVYGGVAAAGSDVVGSTLEEGYYAATGLYGEASGAVGALLKAKTALSPKKGPAASTAISQKQQLPAPVQQQQAAQVKKVAATGGLGLLALLLLL